MDVLNTANGFNSSTNRNRASFQNDTDNLSVVAQLKKTPKPESFYAFNEYIKVIPARVHCVWLKKPPPDYFLRNVYRFLIFNGPASKSLDKYRITIWSDRPALILKHMLMAEESLDPILASLANRLNNLLDIGFIKIKHISKLFTAKKNKKLIHKDNLLYLQSLVLRNLYGPAKNLAAASDILRLFALNKGGIYIDADVSISETIPSIQRSSITNWLVPKTLIDHRGWGGGNHIMAVAPNSWFVRAVLTKVCSNIDKYTYLLKEKTILQLPFSFDNQLDVTWHQQRWGQDTGNCFNRKNLTLMTSGPVSVYEVASRCRTSLFPSGLGSNHEDPVEYDKKLTQYKVASPISLGLFNYITTADITEGVVAEMRDLDNESGWCVINKKALKAEDTINISGGI
jgi:hypothetical protein